MLRNWLCVVAICAVGASAWLVHRDAADYSSLSNKTPKMPEIFSDACEECQVVIRKLAEVAQDPGKVAELKTILLVLCDETSYKDECRIFVNRIDLFLDKLLPYLKNPHAVCHRLHICANSKLQSYHHIGMYFAKKYIADKSVAASTLLCDECHFAVDELKTLVESPQYQKEVKEFLSHEVCAKLGGYRGRCDEALDIFLPDVWEQLKKLLEDENQFCVDLKLCKPKEAIFAASIADSDATAEEGEESAEETSAAVAQRKAKNGAFGRLMASVDAISLKNVTAKIGASCLECRVGVEALLYEIRKANATEALCEKLREMVCGRVTVDSARQMCEDFVGVYTPDAILAALQEINAKWVCTKLKTCTVKSNKAVSHLMHRSDFHEVKCELCKDVSQILVLQLSTVTIRNEIVDDVVFYMCGRLPKSSYYVCENLVKGYVPIVLTKLLQALDRGDLCYKVRACASTFDSTKAQRQDSQEQF